MTSKRRNLTVNPDPGSAAALPGNRFEALKGDRKGRYGIRFNDQWRVCFEWPKGSKGPLNVEIVDWHCGRTDNATASPTRG